MRRAAVLILSICVGACGSSGTTTTSPSITTPAPTLPATVTVKVTGTVTDQTGRGIASAVVQVVDGVDANKAAVTAADGTFSITGLMPADITVRVTAPGYVVLNQALSLKVDGQLAVVLVPTARTIAGTVTDATSGGVLPNVRISLGASTTLTDGAGKYTLAGVTSDAVVLTATATSYLDNASSVPSGGNTVQNFVMVRVASAPAGPTATVTFSRLTGLPYSESGFSVVSTLATWFSSGYGNPGPSLQFLVANGAAVDGEVRITGGGAAFRFLSVDLYSSITQIPYVFTGISGSTTVFTVSGRQGNTFGNFVTVANPQSSVAIDTLLIRLTNTVPSICCGGNPMGIDNVVMR
jgi:hypothetical protein